MIIAEIYKLWNGTLDQYAHASEAFNTAGEACAWLGDPVNYPKVCDGFAMLINGDEIGRHIYKGARQPVTPGQNDKQHGREFKTVRS